MNRIVTVTLLLAVAGLITPKAAKCQTRGTIQVSATVVDLGASAQAVTATRQVVQAWASDSRLQTGVVSGIAPVRVDVASSSGQPVATRSQWAAANNATATEQSLVVTVTYLN